MKKNLLSVIFTTLFFTGCLVDQELPREDIYMQRGDFEDELVPKKVKEKPKGAITFGSNVNSFSSPKYPPINYIYNNNYFHPMGGGYNWSDPFLYLYYPGYNYFPNIYFPPQNVSNSGKEKINAPRTKSLGTTLPQVNENQRRTSNFKKKPKKYLPLNQNPNFPTIYNRSKNIPRGNKGKNSIQRNSNRRR